MSSILTLILSPDAGAFFKSIVTERALPVLEADLFEANMRAKSVVKKASAAVTGLYTAIGEAFARGVKYVEEMSVSTKVDGEPRHSDHVG